MCSTCLSKTIDDCGCKECSKPSKIVYGEEEGFMDFCVVCGHELKKEGKNMKEENNESLVLVYPHFLRKVRYKNFWEKHPTFEHSEIVYISESTEIVKIDENVIKKKLEFFENQYGLEHLRIVAMGYSPFVAAISIVAYEMNIPIVYFNV